MAASAIALLLLLLLLPLLVPSHGHAQLETDRYHGRPGGHRPRHRDGAGAGQTRPPSPAPPTPPPVCNRTIVPEGTHTKAGTATDCLDPPPPPPRNAGRRCFCAPARRPQVPPHEQGSLSCVAPLAAVMTCGSFLTGTEENAPTPSSDCCTGLSHFFQSSATAAGSYLLQCLCPVILGDVNKMLPKPIDPVRMMYLPIACGVVVPPQVLYICFTEQQSPELVGHVTQVWVNSSSFSAAPSP